MKSHKVLTIIKIECEVYADNPQQASDYVKDMDVYDILRYSHGKPIINIIENPTLEYQKEY